MPFCEWLPWRTVVIDVGKINHLAITPLAITPQASLPLAMHGHAPLASAACFRRDPPFWDSIPERSAQQHVESWRSDVNGGELVSRTSLLVKQRVFIHIVCAQDKLAQLSWKAVWQ